MATLELLKVSNNEKEECEKDGKSTKYMLQYFAAFVATLASFTMGWQNAWQAPTMLKFNESNSPFQLEPTHISILAVMYQAGAIPGCILAYHLCKKCGRKFTIIISALPFLVASALLIFTHDIVGYVISRLANGISGGLVTTSTAIYLNEIASPEIRGKITGFYIAQMYAGSFICFAIVPLISIQMNGILMSIPPLAMLVLAYWIPESPYFYLLKRDDKRAAIALEQLGYANVKAKLATLKEYIPRKKTRVMALFEDSVTRRALALLAVMMFGNIYSGRISIKVYSQIMINDSKSFVGSHMAGIIFSIVICLVTIPYAALVDKFGRRFMMLLSTLSTSVPLITLGVYYALKEHNYTFGSWFDVTPFACILTWFVTYAFGLEALPFTCIGELMATEVRGFSSCLLTISMNFMAVFSIFIHQWCDETFGLGSVYFLYATCCLCIACVLFLFQPETKGKTLEEIQDLLRSRKRTF